MILEFPHKINWWFWRENSNETFYATCHLALKLLIHYYWLHTPAVLYSKFRRKYLEYRETKEEIKGDFMPIQYIVLRVITSSYMWPRFTMPFWHKSAFDGKVPVFLVLVQPLPLLNQVIIVISCLDSISITSKQKNLFDFRRFLLSFFFEALLSLGEKKIPSLLPSFLCLSRLLGAWKVFNLKQASELSKQKHSSSLRGRIHLEGECHWIPSKSMS